jgi:hypothetical protein
VKNAYSVETRDRPGLLFAMMRTFASNHGQIAFEGNLAGTELYALEGAAYGETPILKRATTAPCLDFVVLPLTPARVPEIEKAVRSKIAFGGYKGIIHVQIEANGELAFGAYDNFHAETVMIYGQVGKAALDDLVANGTLRSYTQRQL